MNPRLAVVIPTRNRAELLARCLDSIDNQDYPVQSIVVVDNGSTDGTSSVVAHHRNVMAVRFETNLGIDRALGIGMSRALESGADVVFVTDDDSVVLPHTISTLIKTLDRLSYRAVVNALPIVSMNGELISCRVSKGRLVRTRTEFRQAFGRFVYTNKVHFNGSVLSRHVIETVGLPDPRFFSGEETAYGDRIRANGYDIVIDADANILHPPMPFRMIRIPFIGYFAAWDLPDWKAQHYPFNALIRRRMRHGLGMFLMVDVPLVSLVYMTRLLFERHRARKAKMYLSGLWNGIRQGVSAHAASEGRKLDPSK